VEFIVSTSIGVEISDLDVVPNPVGEYTDITFSHNMPGRNLDVRLEIYDVTGRTIRTLEASEFFESPVAGPFRWDRRDYRGRKVKSGVYPFRISIRSNSGEYTLTGGTLILK
jgi:flagellar hook assembly protein FlgD